MRLMITGCLFAAACFAITAPAAAQSIGGRYIVQGQNLNGTTYDGTAEIVVTSQNTCRITWITGNTTSQGICMRNGVAFSAGYALQGKVGLVIYEIKPDGVMEGIWTIADIAGIGRERLIPRR